MRLLATAHQVRVEAQRPVRDGGGELRVGSGGEVDGRDARRVRAGRAPARHLQEASEKVQRGGRGAAPARSDRHRGAGRSVGGRGGAVV